MFCLFLFCFSLLLFFFFLLLFFFFFLFRLCEWVGGGICGVLWCECMYVCFSPLLFVIVCVDGGLGVYFLFIIVLLCVSL